VVFVVLKIEKNLLLLVFALNAFAELVLTQPGDDNSDRS